MAISPQRLTIYLYSAHRAVIFAIAQLSCSKISANRIPVSITFFHLPATLLSFPDYVLPHLSLAQLHEPKSFNHF